MQLRQAKLDEWEQIYKLGGKNSKLLGPSNPAEIRDAIAKESLLVVSHEDKIVAFCLYNILKKSDMITVSQICVDDNYRGNKLASKMLDHILDTYKRNIKTTCVEDSTAELFWSKVAEKYEELPGKKRPICRYRIEKFKSRRLF